MGVNDEHLYISNQLGDHHSVSFTLYISFLSCVVYVETTSAVVRGNIYLG